MASDDFAQAVRQLRRAKARGWIVDFQVVDHGAPLTGVLEGVHRAPPWHRFTVIFEAGVPRPYSTGQALAFAKGLRAGYAAAHREREEGGR